ncbi:MAG: acetylglutamate kinase [Nitrospirae bacterium]|nr:acetylglutamate kinase [Nitrospirota bacterium]
MLSRVEKAKVLIEALPYIRAFAGKTIVIKYGGSAMTDPALKESFALDVILLSTIGMHPVVVHGGGPQINRTMERMGKVPAFVHGLRVTDAETMEIVEMVLGGAVNKEIVSFINRHGGRAVGLTGKDASLIQARKVKVRKPGSRSKGDLIDIGQIGEVANINVEVLDSLRRDRIIPVIAPIGVGPQGESYNVNADLVAGAAAAALSAEKLILLTDVAGILDKKKELIPTLTRAQARKRLADGTLTGGMIPKVTACLDALAGGVPKAHVVDGRVPHAILLEIFTDRGVGTEIVP